MVWQPQPPADRTPGRSIGQAGSTPGGRGRSGCPPALVAVLAALALWSWLIAGSGVLA